MRGRAKEPWWGTVIEAPDAHRLAAFYSGLLGWPVVDEEPGGAVIKPPQSFVYVAFQTAADFTPPVWPAVDGRQRMTMHLDIEVESLSVPPSLRSNRRRTCGCSWTRQDTRSASTSTTPPSTQSDPGNVRI